MMVLFKIIVTILAVGLIFSGIRAILKKRTMASSDGADEHEYAGTSAKVLGIVWILLGCAMLFLGDKFFVWFF